MTFSLFKFLILVFILFIIGLTGIFLNRKNLIIILMSIEIILLSINLNFIVFSLYLDDVVGGFISILILTIAAAESSIGLAIFVVYYRIYNNLSLSNFLVKDLS